MPVGTNHPDVDYSKTHYRESVERMFAAVSDLYAEYWNDFFHFAIFEDDEESWESAYQKTYGCGLINGPPAGDGAGRFAPVVYRDVFAGIAAVDVGVRPGGASGRRTAT